MTKKLRIASAILFGLLVATYGFFFTGSLFMLYVIGIMPSAPNPNVQDLIIGYVMFSILATIGLLCLLSSLFALDNPRVKTRYQLLAYLFIPLGLPYFLINRELKKIKTKFEMVDDRLLVNGFLVVVSIINFFLALIDFSLGLLLSLPTIVGDNETLVIGLPLILISSSIFIGTIANILDYNRPSRLARWISCLGFIFVWFFQGYRLGLWKNGLMPKRWTFSRDQHHQLGNGASDGSHYPD